MLTAMAKTLLWCARALGSYRVYRILNACYLANPDAVMQLLNYWLRQEYPRRPIADDLLFKYVDPSLLIRMLQQSTDVQDSPFYAFHAFAEMERACQRLNFRPKHVLEVGPGSSLGAIACFLAGGSESASAVDIQPITKDRTAHYRQMGDYLSCVGGFAWWRHYADKPEDARAQYPRRWGSEALVDYTKRVRYVAPAPAERLPFHDHEFDLVYSLAVLEHVSDPQATVREIARVTAPDGYSIHEIDLRHHGSKDFIRFLELDEAQWTAVTRTYGDGRSLDAILDGSWSDEVYCNRLRMSDWVRAFTDAGFCVVSCEKLCVLDESRIDRTRLAEGFRGRTMEDLATVQIRLLARKAVGR